MSKEGVKRWNATLDAVFRPLERFLDKRRRKKSFEQPFICGHGRDTLRYYENGHYVEIEAELMFGDLNRLIYRNYSLKWDDSEEVMSAVEAESVMQKFCAELDRKKIRWKFGDGV